MNRQRSLLEAILHRQDGKSIRIQARLLQNLVATGRYPGMAVNAGLNRREPRRWGQMCAKGFPSPWEWGITGSQARVSTHARARCSGVLRLLFSLLCFLASCLKIFSLPLKLFSFWVGHTQPRGRALCLDCESWVQFPVQSRLDPNQGFVFEEPRSQKGFRPTSLLATHVTALEWNGRVFMGLSLKL